MCGITGIISSKNTFSLGDLELLNNDIRHRGPDDEGYSVILDKSKEVTFLKGKDFPVIITRIYVTLKIFVHL